MARVEASYQGCLNSLVPSMPGSAEHSPGVQGSFCCGLFSRRCGSVRLFLLQWCKRIQSCSSRMMSSSRSACLRRCRICVAVLPVLVQCAKPILSSGCASGRACIANRSKLRRPCGWLRCCVRVRAPCAHICWNIRSTLVQWVTASRAPARTPGGQITPRTSCGATPWRRWRKWRRSAARSGGTRTATMS